MPRGRVKEGLTINCIVCNKEFYIPKSLSGRKFCSITCRDVHIRSKRVNEEEGIARCARCKEWKPIDDFVKGNKNRPHSYCKPCSSDWFAERRGTPEEKRKKYMPFFRLTPEQKKENKRQANWMQHQARRAAGPKPNKFDIQRILCEQDARCAYCRQLLSGQYHIDHKTPVSRGGTNDLSNLHLTCPKCNMKKGAMTHEEFLVSKKRKSVKW